ncbi:MAG: hypothetical protein ABJA78_13400 [Ferruginibacter sp.]
MKNSLFIFFILPAVIISSCSQTSPNNSVRASNDSIIIPPKIKVASDREPGERMIISGTVYLPDAKTAANNAILSVWHTDAKGFYIEGGGGAGEEHPRIHGRLKTGADGKYEFRSIRPAPYPGNNTPAHIHAHISAPGFPEYALIYYFEGDPLITDQNITELNNHRGGTPSVIKLMKDSNGVFIGHRDIILEYVKPSEETMKLKW